MDEHMREKEIAKIQVEDDARRQDEARMMARLNGNSQPINLNFESELDEHIKEKEMAKLQTEADARRQDEARMMAKLNEIFDYSYDATEDVARKRR